MVLLEMVLSRPVSVLSFTQNIGESSCMLVVLTEGKEADRGFRVEA